MKRIWLKELRKQKNLTQGDVAFKATISRIHYTLIENGTRNPSSEVAGKIAKFLKFNKDQWNF